jgi:hypothetical protein
MASGKDTASHTSDHDGWHDVQSPQKRRVAAMPLNVIHYCCVVVWHGLGQFGTILIKIENLLYISLQNFMFM